VILPNTLMLGVFAAIFLGLTRHAIRKSLA